MVAPFLFSESRGRDVRSTIGPKYWEKFRSFKERGEWVELQFMAAAAQRRFAVSKPWGDTLAYDVGIEEEGNFLRVQVKSTTTLSGAGYVCQFHPNHKKKRDYSLDQIDIFAAYVIPEDVWYLIPAVLLLGERRKHIAMLCPLVRPKKRACYCYERYRENWDLLKKSRNELLQFRREPAPRSHHKKRTSSPLSATCQGSDGKGRGFKPPHKSANMMRTLAAEDNSQPATGSNLPHPDCATCDLRLERARP